ncbi:HAD family phosphatase [Glycomyces sp. L485]|uniref:HAD family hydrolase n=1 Tax=Glycomyces sp. L485 TaxID=2909235 RepID=UPI001F4B273F|nr:HAD family phosphatase [Glycomyces sp. L485]MCH7231028.1 HAD family phosphatase [Glycomyces sp. L485]
MADGIRVIVTDIGSVLFKFDPEHRFEILAERTGLLRGELEERLFASGFETRCEAGEFTQEEIRDQVGDMIGFDGDTDELSRIWTSAFTPDKDVFDALTSANLPLAIFSNNGPLFADFFDERFPEAAKWFRHRYFACRLKARKPDPEAYRLVEDHLRTAQEASPHQLLFIDDNRQNTAAAAERGWQVHTFTSTEALRSVLEHTG